MDASDRRDGDDLGLVEGSIYTIAKILPRKAEFCGRGNGWNCSALLIEVENRFNARGSFNLARFRPLVAAKTQADDVAHIKRLIGQHFAATPPERIERVDG